MGRDGRPVRRLAQLREVFVRVRILRRLTTAEQRLSVAAQGDAEALHRRVGLRRRWRWQRRGVHELVARVDWIPIHLDDSADALLAEEVVADHERAAGIVE